MMDLVSGSSKQERDATERVERGTFAADAREPQHRAPVGRCPDSVSAAMMFQFPSFR
jgi:hypothetical protein